MKGVSIRASRSLWMLLFTIGIPLFAQSEERDFHGPVGLSDQYTLNAMQLSFTPRAAQSLNEGSLESSLQVSWTNTFTDREKYRVDAERREVRPSISYGLDDETFIGITVPVVWRGGGVLDSFIESWHDWFSLPEGGRDAAPRDQLNIAGELDSGDDFSVPGSGTKLGNATLRLGHELLSSSDGSPTVSLDVLASLPTAGTGYGHNGIDMSLGLIASQQFSALELTFGSAYLYYGDDNIYGVEFAESHNETWGWAEYLLTDSVSLQLGLWWSNITMKNISGHPNHRFYLDTGLSIALSDSDTLNLLVRENPSHSESTADVTFFVGWDAAWG